MNDASIRNTYYFLFGYHHPDGWEAMRHDEEFDYDLTGVLPIKAENEESALEWGMQLAKWYADNLYLEYQELNYQWSPVEYACWTETSVPEGSEECVKEIGEIEVNTYPDFIKLKHAMQD